MCLVSNYGIFFLGKKNIFLKTKTKTEMMTNYTSPTASDFDGFRDAPESGFEKGFGDTPKRVSGSGGFENGFGSDFEKGFGDTSTNDSGGFGGFGGTPGSSFGGFGGNFEDAESDNEQNTCPFGRTRSIDDDFSFRRRSTFDVLDPIRVHNDAVSIRALEPLLGVIVTISSMSSHDNMLWREKQHGPPGRISVWKIGYQRLAKLTSELIQFGETRKCSSEWQALVTEVMDIPKCNAVFNFECCARALLLRLTS